MRQFVKLIREKTKKFKTLSPQYRDAALDEILTEISDALVELDGRTIPNKKPKKPSAKT